MTSRRAVVVGLGNAYRGDDGVGPAVAALVARTLTRSDGTGTSAADGLTVDVLAGLPDPMDLLGRWDDAELAVVVDAARAEPGANGLTGWYHACLEMSRFPAFWTPEMPENPLVSVQLVRRH